MANSYNYAVKYSTENMVAKAYQEYTNIVSDRYAILMTAVEYVISNVEVDTDLEVLVAQAIASMGADYLADDNVPMDNGVTSLHDYLYSIAEATQLDMNDIDDDSEVPNYDRIFEISKLDGTKVSTTVNNILTNMNAIFHAITVENAVAMAYTVGGSISEMISTIRDTIGQKFKDAFVDTSDVLNSTINKVKSGISCTDYIKEKMQSSGIDAAALYNVNISESDDATFTGASPAAAFGWYAAKGLSIVGQATVTAVKAVYTVVKKTLQAVWNIGKRIFKWIKDKVTEIVVDPKDLVKINGEKGNHTANGFNIQLTEPIFSTDSHLMSELEKGPLHCDFFSGEIIVQKDANAHPFRPYTDITSAFRGLAEYFEYTLDVSNGLLTGVNLAWSSNYDSLLEAAQDITHLSTTTSILETINTWMSWRWEYNVCYMIKPKAINPIYFEQISGVWNEQDEYWTVNLSDVITACDAAIEADDLYLDVDNDEDVLYKGFILGAIMTWMIMSVCDAESKGYDPSNQTGRFWVTPALVASNTKSTGITNFDFFKICANGVMVTSADVNVNVIHKDSNLSITNDIKNTLDNIFEYQDENPFDFGFWPYSHNYVTWFDASFRIKSDAENQAAFNTFITTAVIVILVAVVSIAGFVALKRKANLRLANAMGKEWDVTEKAQKGLLTTADIKAWKKAKRKANRLSFLTGNLTSSAKEVSSNMFNNVNNYDDVSVDFTPVIDLITG